MLPLGRERTSYPLDSSISSISFRFSGLSSTTITVPLAADRASVAKRLSIDSIGALIRTTNLSADLLRRFMRPAPRCDAFRARFGARREYAPRATNSVVIPGRLHVRDGLEHGGLPFGRRLFDKAIHGLEEQVGRSEVGLRKHGPGQRSVQHNRPAAHIEILAPA